MGTLMPFFLPFPPDDVILGCKLQRDKNCGLEVAFSGRGCKDTADAAEGNVFKVDQGAL